MAPLSTQSKNQNPLDSLQISVKVLGKFQGCEALVAAGCLTHDEVRGKDRTEPSWTRGAEAGERVRER